MCKKKTKKHGTGGVWWGQREECMLRHLQQDQASLHLLGVWVFRSAEPSQACQTTTARVFVHVHLCVETYYPIFECNQSSTKDVCVPLKPSAADKHGQLWSQFPRKREGIWLLQLWGARWDSLQQFIMYTHLRSTRHALLQTTTILTVQQANSSMTGRLGKSVLLWHEIMLHTCATYFCTRSLVLTWLALKDNPIQHQECSQLCVCVCNRGYFLLSPCFSAFSPLFSLSFHIKMLTLFSQDSW